VTGIGNFFSLPPLSIQDEVARRLQLPSKLMAQHKFGTRRRAMLSFERQPFPAPSHVDQDVAHSQAWRALGHLTTFDRVLSAFHRRNHLPLPPGPLKLAMLPRATRCGQHRFAPGVHFGANSDLCATAYLRAVRVRDLCAARSAGWVPHDFEARSTWPTSDKGSGIGCRLIRPHKQCLLMGERL
jgi:hypothetical protein